MQKEIEIEKIKSMMIGQAERRNLKTTKNFEKIANAKYICFSSHDKNPLMCPCDANNEERFCISERCMKDIEQNGVCHCGCYCKKD